MIKCEVPNCDREFKTKSGYLSHLRAHKRAGDITPEMAEERRRRRLEEKIRRLKRQRDFYEKEAAVVDRICEIIRGAVTPLPEIEAPLIPIPDEAKMDETAVLFISDVHVGKMTPSYNFDVFSDRLLRLQSSTLSIVSALRSIRPIKKLVVVFGGDKLLCLLTPLIRRKPL